MARLEAGGPDRYVYRLDPMVAFSAFRGGATPADLLETWEQTMPQPVPAAFRKAVLTWWASYGQIRLYKGLSLLELHDEFALSELEATTSLGQHILARLSPQLVLVPNKAVDTLLQEFLALGHTPNETR
jgi:hypothetical protein